MQFQSFLGCNFAVPGRRWTTTGPASSAENRDHFLSGTIRITTPGMGSWCRCGRFPRCRRSSVARADPRTDPGDPRSSRSTHPHHGGWRRRCGMGIGGSSAIHSTALTAQVLDLRSGFSEVWSKRFTSKVRSNSRKAERRGVVVESDNTGRLVPVFDSLYRSSVEQMGSGAWSSISFNALACAASRAAKQVCDSGTEDGRALYRVGSVAGW